MTFSVKSILGVLMAMTLLVACNQQDQQSEAGKETPATEQQNDAKQAATDERAAETTPEEHDEQHDAQPDHGQHDSHDHAAHDAAPVDGQKYQVIEAQAECTKPVVMEFYAYQCPHCYNLEPEAAAWRKKNADKVEFVTVPTHLGHEQMGSMLLVHHAAKALGILEPVQHAMFNRFHQQKQLFASEEEAAQFLAEQGADLEKAKQALADQKAITDSINIDFKLLNDYKITSVPQVLVNHKYMTSTTLAGSPKAVFETVDQVLKLDNDCG